MYGTGAQKKSVLGNVGAMTLEQMELDRREDFSNFDPFMYQQRQQYGEGADIQLQQSANYMGVQNTIGIKMNDSLPQQPSSNPPATFQQKPFTSNNLDDLEELEEI